MGEAGAGEEAADAAVGACDEGVGAVVDIQQCGLGTLEENGLVLGIGVQEMGLDIADEGQQRCGEFHQARNDGLDGGQFGRGAEEEAHLLVAGADAFRKAFGVLEVAHANAHAGRLHLVGGADAAPCGADLVGASPAFAPLIQGDVVRKNHVGFFGDKHASGDVNAALGETIQLLPEHFQIEQDARTHHQEALWVQGAAGNLVKGDALPVDHYGVAGVVAALETNHVAELGAEEVHQLAFALVAPLQTEYGEVPRGVDHGGLPAFKITADTAFFPLANATQGHPHGLALPLGQPGQGLRPGASPEQNLRGIRV